MSYERKRRTRRRQKKRRCALAIARCECVSYDVVFLAVTRAQNTEWRERNGKQGCECVRVRMCVHVRTARDGSWQERGTRLDKASAGEIKGVHVNPPLLDKGMPRPSRRYE